MSKFRTFKGWRIRNLAMGGGHGFYSIQFCQRYPNLIDTVFDWPQALEIAAKTVDQEGMVGRVELQSGDIWVDDLGKEYDIALLFNIIHMYSPEKNIDLIKRVSAALKSPGLIVIMDQVASKGRGTAAKALARWQGLQLFNSVMGQTYPTNEIADWLKDTGFSNINTQMIRKAPSSGLVMGMKVN